MIVDGRAGVADHGRGCVNTAPTCRAATGGCGTYPTIEVAKINQFGTPEQQSKLNTFLYIYIYFFYIHMYGIYISLSNNIHHILHHNNTQCIYIYIYQQVTL